MGLLHQMVQNHQQKKKNLSHSPISPTCVRLSFSTSQQNSLSLSRLQFHSHSPSPSPQISSPSPSVLILWSHSYPSPLPFPFAPHRISLPFPRCRSSIHQGTCKFRHRILRRRRQCASCNPPPPDFRGAVLRRDAVLSLSKNEFSFSFC